MSKCPKCGKENANSAKFCEECGNTLITEIPKSKNEISRKGIYLHYNNKYIGNIPILVILALFSILMPYTALLLLGYVGFNLVKPGHNIKTRTAKFGVLLVMFILAAAIAPHPTTTDSPQVQAPATTVEQQPVTQEEQPKDFWAANYPKLTDKCPNCGNAAKLDEKTDKIYTFYCPKCNAIYGINLYSDDHRIGFDPQGEGEMKYFPSN